jgi:hypothetical protein
MGPNGGSVAMDSEQEAFLNRFANTLRRRRVYLKRRYIIHVKALLLTSFCQILPAVPFLDKPGRGWVALEPEGKF